MAQSTQQAGQTELTKVRDLIVTGLANVDARIYLFGSWARGEQKRTSDIDIAIEHQGNVTPEIFMKIRELLEESSIPYRVDVVDLVKAGSMLAQKVKEEGILWQDYSKG